MFRLITQAICLCGSLQYNTHASHSFLTFSKKSDLIETRMKQGGILLISPPDCLFLEENIEMSEPSCWQIILAASKS